MMPTVSAIATTPTAKERAKRKAHPATCVPEGATVGVYHAPMCRPRLSDARDRVMPFPRKRLKTGVERRRRCPLAGSGRGTSPGKGLPETRISYTANQRGGDHLPVTPPHPPAYTAQQTEQYERDDWRSLRGRKDGAAHASTPASNS